jgi:hypothetical protein
VEYRSNRFREANSLRIYNDNLNRMIYGCQREEVQSISRRLAGLEKPTGYRATDVEMIDTLVKL